LNADKAIKMPIVNSSNFSFAYPSAKFTFPNGLPDGMSIFSNSLGFEPFASSWNPGDTAFAYCMMNVSQPIPNNTMIFFNVKVTQLEPSNVDTCFFQAPYFVNITEIDTVMSIENNYINTVKLFPNPAKNWLQVNSEQVIKTLKIVRYDGMLISTYNFPSNNINIEHLQPGLHLILTETLSGHLNLSRIIKN